MTSLPRLSCPPAHTHSAALRFSAMAPPQPSQNQCCPASSLFCSEDVSGCLSDDDIACCEGEVQEGFSIGADHEATAFAQQLEEPLDVQESVAALSEREVSHVPRSDYAQKFQAKVLDAGARQKAVEWLFKVRSMYSFGPLTAALSVNYLDRFLSLHQLPNGKAWMMQLLSVACLSLAAKMEESDVPLLLDLQVGSDYLFEPRTVQRMELLVGSTLGWRMSSVTPFSYADYFIRRLGLSSNAQRVLHSRVEEVILCVIQELGFLVFRPSAIAAGATLCCIRELYADRFESYKRQLLSVLPQYLQATAEKCCEEIGRVLWSWCRRSEASGKYSVPPSPAGVLDASFSSNSNSDSESMIKCAGSDASVYTPSSPPPSKKIKLHDLRTIQNNVAAL